MTSPHRVQTSSHIPLPRLAKNSARGRGNLPSYSIMAARSSNSSSWSAIALHADALGCGICGICDICGKDAGEDLCRTPPRMSVHPRPAVHATRGERRYRAHSRSMEIPLGALAARKPAASPQIGCFIGKVNAVIPQNQQWEANHGKRGQHVREEVNMLTQVLTGSGRKDR